MGKGRNVKKKLFGNNSRELKSKGVPGKKTESDDYTDMMLPEGIEFIHPRFAISCRNNWML